MDYSLQLAARVLLHASSHRQEDNTYHSLCYTSWRALAGTRNSYMGPLHEGSIRRPIAPWANALTTELRLAPPPGSPHCEKNTVRWLLTCLKHVTHYPCNRTDRFRQCLAFKHCMKDTVSLYYADTICKKNSCQDKYFISQITLTG